MQNFLTRHGDRIQGVLSGFDRLLFRGTLRSISYVSGLEKWLGYHHLLYKDSGAFAERMSERLKGHAQAVARRAGRPYVYLERAGISKEAYATRLAEQDSVTHGLVCVLAAVEPCQTFALRKEGRDEDRAAHPHRAEVSASLYRVEGTTQRDSLVETPGAIGRAAPQPPL